MLLISPTLQVSISIFEKKKKQQQQNFNHLFSLNITASKINKS
jgi:hypothetical protein